MAINHNDSSNQHVVNFSDDGVLDRILAACEVEVNSEHRKQLRRFAQEYQEIKDGQTPTFAEFVAFSRPRLMPSEG